MAFVARGSVYSANLKWDCGDRQVDVQQVPRWQLQTSEHLVAVLSIYCFQNIPEVEQIIIHITFPLRPLIRLSQTSEYLFQHEVFRRTIAALRSKRLPMGRPRSRCRLIGSSQHWKATAGPSAWRPRFGGDLPFQRTTRERSTSQGGTIQQRTKWSQGQ